MTARIVVCALVMSATAGRLEGNSEMDVSRGPTRGMSRIHTDESATERERRLIRAVSSGSGWASATRLEQATLEDTLWSAYSGYVVTHCHRAGDLWVLDEMADELFTLAVNWEIHRTF